MALERTVRLVKISRLATLVVVAVGLTACSTGSWEPAALPAVDPDVVAVLPVGTYTFTGRLLVDSVEVTKASGFVDFGAAADGADCESDYVLTEVRNDSTSPVKKVRGVRTAGLTSFYQDLSDESKAGEWEDIADPKTNTGLLLFAPAIIVSNTAAGTASGVGNGDLCSIGVMPRFMTFNNGALTFDAGRTAQVVEATRGHWAVSFVDALGLQGRERNQTVERLTYISTGSFESVTQATITISRLTDGGFTLVQAKQGKPMVELTFSPAPDRVVNPVDAATYFENIAKDVRENGLEKTLADAGL